MEHDKKNGSGAATAAGSGVGRLLVDETCSNRHRFEVELKEGETTIVSWTKLLQESGISAVVDNDSPPPPNPKMEYCLLPNTGSPGNLTTEVTELEPSHRNAN